MSHIIQLLIFAAVAFFVVRAIRRSAGVAASVRASPERAAAAREALAGLLNEFEPNMPAAERREMLAEFGIPEAPAHSIAAANNAQVEAARAAARAREASHDEAAPVAAKSKRAKKQTDVHHDSSHRPPHYGHGVLDAFAPFAALDPLSPAPPLKKRRPLAISAPLEPMGDTAAYAARS
jgi:hypothetical protein